MMKENYSVIVTISMHKVKRNPSYSY